MEKNCKEIRGVNDGEESGVNHKVILTLKNGDMHFFRI